MEYVYAALLLHKLKQDITEDNVKNIIKAAGATPNDVQVKALVSALGEVNIDEALKSTPIATAPVAAPVGGAPEASGSQPKAEEEKKEEKKEEEALEGLSALFG